MSGGVTIIGLEKLQADLNKLTAAAQSSIVMDGLEAGARVIQAHAQENVRNKLNKHPLGNLVNNITVRREGKSVLVGVWGVIYAAIHEFGGLIFARNKPFLVFQIDGKWIKTKKVVMPARPYLRPALDENLDEIKGAIEATLGGLLGKVL